MVKTLKERTLESRIARLEKLIKMKKGVNEGLVTVDGEEHTPEEVANTIEEISMSALKMVGAPTWYGVSAQCNVVDDHTWVVYIYDRGFIYNKAISIIMEKLERTYDANFSFNREKDSTVTILNITAE